MPNYKFLYSKLLKYKKKRSMKTIISKYFMNDMSNNFFFNQIQILIAYISVKKNNFRSLFEIIDSNSKKWKRYYFPINILKYWIVTNWRFYLIVY